MIATPMETHGTLVRRRAHKAIWCEKPFAASTGGPRIGVNYAFAFLDAVQRHHQVPLTGDIVLDPTMAVAIADKLAHDFECFAPGTTAANPGAIAAGDARWPWWRELAEQLAMDGMTV